MSPRRSGDLSMGEGASVALLSLVNDSSRYIRSIRPLEVMRALSGSQETGEARLQELTELYQVERHSIGGNGNCQFAAFSMGHFGTVARAAEVRAAVVADLRAHPEYDYESRTLWRPTFPSYAAYLDAMEQDGEWGDSTTLETAARIYRRNVTVISTVDNSQHLAEITPALALSGRDAQRMTAQGETILLGHIYDQHFDYLTPLVSEDDIHRKLKTSHTSHTVTRKVPKSANKLKRQRSSQALEGTTLPAKKARRPRKPKHDDTSLRRLLTELEIVTATAPFSEADVLQRLVGCRLTVDGEDHALTKVNDKGELMAKPAAGRSRRSKKFTYKRLSTAISKDPTIRILK